MGATRVRPPHSPERDRKLAEHVVVVLLRKRDTMPLTVGFMQAVCKQGFGVKVGRARASAMISHLQSTSRITLVGRYRGKKHGFWVGIYRLAPVIVSVARNSRVKGRPWWQHPLFGTPDGKPPPGTSKRQRKWWRDPRFLIAEKERAWLANEVS
jgi:hypothetical protein